MATLQAGNERGGDAGSRGQIDLPPVATLADKSDDRPETLVTHGVSLARDAHPPRTSTRRPFPASFLPDLRPRTLGQEIALRGLFGLLV